MATTQRIALVTGASGGIGRAVARILAQAGMRVACSYNRNEDGARETLALVQEAGADGKLFQADLADPKAAEALVSSVEAEFGKVDVLVNNAGSACEKLLLDTSVAEWDHVMAVHLRAAFVCTKACLPGMIRRGFGRVINVTSMWGQVGAANEVAYSTAKAGLIGFTKALAKEVGRAGITVNAVAPGVIQTSMLEGHDEAAVQELIDATPVGRIGTPDDVARVVRFLADESADFITGQVFAANGGFVT